MGNRMATKKKRTPAQEHQMAMVSAYSTVQTKGQATVAEVCRNQGLVEIRAKKALEDLVKAKKLRKSGRLYYIPLA